ncbi:hypothetical protein DFP72DRAFT_856859 [Ephemerocybe angulata]|uniref:F-box domain-containing protein n=1 Tax=Ephemerocybe angulata TaxID=980116 RepID=A0A8H6HDD4_9AGAR|nr:hypothetical protein DFP72DRAFT_856859 [Tulosesus angulatus]
MSTPLCLSVDILRLTKFPIYNPINISRLPNELLYHIFNVLENKRDLISLMRTCHRCHIVGAATVYQSVTVDAGTKRGRALLRALSRRTRIGRVYADQVKKFKYLSPITLQVRPREQIAQLLVRVLVGLRNLKILKIWSRIFNDSVMESHFSRTLVIRRRLHPICFLDDMKRGFSPYSRLILPNLRQLDVMGHTELIRIIRFRQRSLGTAFCSLQHLEIQVYCDENAFYVSNGNYALPEIFLQLSPELKQLRSLVLRGPATDRFLPENFLKLLIEYPEAYPALEALGVNVRPARWACECSETVTHCHDYTLLEEKRNIVLQRLETLAYSKQALIYFRTALTEFRLNEESKRWCIANAALQCPGRWS